MKKELMLDRRRFLAAKPLFAQENPNQGSLLVNPIPMPEWLETREREDLNRTIPGDEAKMYYVVQLASENVRRRTGGPFAAAIFELKSDRLIALGVNVVVPSKQSWAHAEMIAFAHAQNRLKSHSLAGCVLVTSCEPCAMCSGATPWSGVGEMIYGATKEMAEAAGFDEGYKGENWRAEFEKRKIKVVGPLLGNAANEPFELYKKMQGAVY